VVNTDPLGKEGQHWLAFFYDINGKCLVNIVLYKLKNIENEKFYLQKYFFYSKILWRLQFI
jgi:hypothetical protein